MISPTATAPTLVAMAAATIREQPCLSLLISRLEDRPYESQERAHCSSSVTVVHYERTETYPYAHCDCPDDERYGCRPGACAYCGLQVSRALRAHRTHGKPAWRIKLATFIPASANILPVIVGVLLARRERMSAAATVVKSGVYYCHLVVDPSARGELQIPLCTSK